MNQESIYNIHEIEDIRVPDECIPLITLESEFGVSNYGSTILDMDEQKGTHSVYKTIPKPMSDSDIIEMNSCFSESADSCLTKSSSSDVCISRKRKQRNCENEESKQKKLRDQEYYRTENFFANIKSLVF